jgi:hypothetical protein
MSASSPCPDFCHDPGDETKEPPLPEYLEGKAADPPGVIFHDGGFSLFFDEKNPAEQAIKQVLEKKAVLMRLKMEKEGAIMRLKQKFVKMGTYKIMQQLNPWFVQTLEPRFSQEEIYCIQNRAIAIRDVELFKHFQYHRKDEYNYGLLHAEADKQLHRYTQQKNQQNALLQWLLSLTEVSEIESLLNALRYPYVIFHALNHYQEHNQWNYFKLCVKLHPYVNGGDCRNPCPKAFNFTAAHLEYALQHRDFDVADIIVRNQMKIRKHFKARFTKAEEKDIRDWIDQHSSSICIIL